MSSVEWVYIEGATSTTQQERKVAMTYADQALHGVIPPKANRTDLENEALRIRKAELSWSDVNPAEVRWIRVKPSQVFWAVLGAQATLAAAGTILYAIIHS
jgi:hypothetical protein